MLQRHVPAADVIRAEGSFDSHWVGISTVVILLVVHVEVLLVRWRPVVVNARFTWHIVMDVHHVGWNEVVLIYYIAIMISIRPEVNCSRRLVVCGVEKESKQLKSDEQASEDQDEERAASTVASAVSLLSPVVELCPGAKLIPACKPS